MKSVDNIHR